MPTLIIRTFFIVLSLSIFNSLSAQSVVLKDAREAPTPIAIQAFQKAGSSSETTKFSTDAEALLTADLIFSRLFKVIPAEAFLEPNIVGPIQNIKVESWRTVGAQFLVRARASFEKGEAAIEGYVFDILTGKLRLQETYRTKRKDNMILVHQFADDIVKIVTGQPGLFSTKIAFTYIPPGSRFKEIWVMDFNGRNPKPLVQNGRRNLTPRWSPDGRNIYFTSSSLMDWNIWKTDLNGKSTQITKLKGSALSPTPLPNGRELLISSSKDNNAELYIVDLDGKEKKRLTKHSGIDLAPSLSPDGRFACMTTDRWGHPDIAKINLQSLEVSRLTRVGTQNDTCAWNPRDNLILFSGMDTDREFDIFAMNDEGNEMERLTYDAKFNEAPAWSPDGKLILFSSRRITEATKNNPRYQIYVMKADGTQIGTIADLPGDASQPSWSPRLGY